MGSVTSRPVSSAAIRPIAIAIFRDRDRILVFEARDLVKQTLSIVRWAAGLNSASSA